MRNVWHFTDLESPTVEYFIRARIKRTLRGLPTPESMALRLYVRKLRRRDLKCDTDGMRYLRECASLFAKINGTP